MEQSKQTDKKGTIVESRSKREREREKKKEDEVKKAKHSKLPSKTGERRRDSSTDASLNTRNCKVRRRNKEIRSSEQRTRPPFTPQSATTATQVHKSWTNYTLLRGIEERVPPHFPCCVAMLFVPGLRETPDG